MTRVLTIENETHWRTKDVKRLVRAAMDAAGCDPTKPRILRIRYSRVSKATANYNHYKTPAEIDIHLPKRGTSDPHPSPLVALAGTNVDAETLLAFQDVYRLAHNLAFGMSMADGDKGRGDSLASTIDSVNPPSWGASLYIAKYADPTKDAAFVAFTSKIESKIATAQARVDKWQAEKNRADKNLKRALRDLKSAQRSLKDAKRRRGL